MPSGPRPQQPHNTARVAIIGQNMTHRYVNTFWLNLTNTAVTTADLQALADLVHTNWVSGIKPSICSGATFTEVDITFVDNSGDELRLAAPYNEAGAIASGQLPDAAACYVISAVIGAFYRGGHPRIYIPGVASADVTNGSDLSPSRLSALVAGMGSLRTALNAYTSTGITQTRMGVVHFQRNNAWLSPPTFSAFTSFKVGKKGKLGSQRRRILA